MFDLERWEINRLATCRVRTAGVAASRRSTQQRVSLLILLVLFALRSLLFAIRHLLISYSLIGAEPNAPTRPRVAWL